MKTGRGAGTARDVLEGGKGGGLKGGGEGGLAGTPLLLGSPCGSPYGLKMFKPKPS